MHDMTLHSYYLSSADSATEGETGTGESAHKLARRNFKKKKKKNFHTLSRPGIESVQAAFTRLPTQHSNGAHLRREGAGDGGG